MSTPDNPGADAPPAPPAPAPAPPPEAPRKKPADPAIEIGGPAGPEPTRYKDWERKGRVSDF